MSCAWRHEHGPPLLLGSFQLDLNASYLGTERRVLYSTRPQYLRYRQYHRPIDSREQLGCNQCIGAGLGRKSDGSKRDCVVMDALRNVLTR
jgi:hypothetical protein